MISVVTGQTGRIFCASAVFVCTIIVRICYCSVGSNSTENSSYEYMTCAVGAAVFTAALLERFLPPQLRATLPFTTFDCFMVTWPWTQAVLAAVISNPVGASLWAILGAVPSSIRLIMIGWELKRTSKPGTECCVHRSCCGCIDKACCTSAIRFLLFFFSAGFTVATVMPWGPPVQPFVRWYNFSQDGELLWRGTFCNFVVWNLATALRDPVGQESSYIAFMSAQGILHGLTMVHDIILRLFNSLGLTPIAQCYNVYFH
jgi:hypothetical protein